MSLKKLDENRYEPYNDWRGYMKRWFDRMQKNKSFVKDPRTLQNSWYYYKEEMQNDERDRLCVMLPLIRVEIEEHMLSKELNEELEIYYEDYYNGVFEDLFTEDELVLVKADLDWCYENRKANMYQGK